MDARGRFGGILHGDWRQPGTGGGPAAEPAQVAKPSLGPAALHLGAKRASFAQERQRARELVEHAKAQVAETFSDARFGRQLNVNSLWPLVTGITASITRNPSAISAVTKLQDRHEYTYVHSVAVCGLMISLARRLRIDPTLHHSIGLAGLLHDIGKAKVPTTLLDKPGELTVDERSTVMRHAQWGYEMLLGGDQLPDLVLDVCLHHHERLDGSGYPDARVGDSISLYARMAAICDAFDGLTSQRPHKHACTPAEALEVLAGDVGRYDPEILSAFSGMLGIFPVGSMVRLQSNRLAVVLEDFEGDPSKPPVCPFFCIQTKRDLAFRVAESAIDPILGMEMPSRWPMIAWRDTRNAVIAWLQDQDDAIAQ